MDIDLNLSFYKLRLYREKTTDIISQMLAEIGSITVEDASSSTPENECEVCFFSDGCLYGITIIEQATTGFTVTKGDNKPLERGAMLSYVIMQMGFRSDCLRKDQFDAAMRKVINQYSFTNEELGIGHGNIYSISEE